jgi:HSP20 family molecular chaperone IbpA
LLLGFEEIERMVEKITRTSGDGYPPYNIEKVDDSGVVKLRITLAVAGFSDDDLDVSIENNQLTIKGRQSVDLEREYLHRGIAARQFQKNFILAAGIEIEGAELKNGLLSIDLVRPEPVSNARRIKINRLD